MAFQTKGAVAAKIKREVTHGVAAASGAGALRMRNIDSAGLELARSVIQSQERRPSAMKAKGRLGGKNADGGFNREITVGGVTDMELESILRSVWSAALVITEATGAAGALTVNANNQMTRTGGSWITDGIRVGDMVTLTGYSTAANNDLRVRVTALSALVLTVAGTPFTVGASDAVWTLTRAKKIITPVTPTEYSHTIEQEDEIIDAAELFVGCRLTGLNFGFRPNAVSSQVATYMALDRQILASGATPYFTSPALTSGSHLIADDSSIRYNGQEVATFQGFDLNFQIEAERSQNIGSFVSAGVFLGDLSVTGSIIAMRQDLSNLTLFDAETEFEVSIMLREPGVAPVGGLMIHLSRCSLAKVSSPFGGTGGGPKLETYELLVGERSAATGFDAGAVQIYSTAA